MGKKAGRSFWVPGLQKPAYIMIGIYVILVASFYFLAGDQLHLRQSRGNLDMPEAESGTVELVQGAVVEQKFSCEIQRLQRVNVQWGAFYRVNSGTVTMELYNLQNRALLLSQSYDAAGITEGGILSLTAPEPMEGLFKAPLAVCGGGTCRIAGRFGHSAIPCSSGKTQLCSKCTGSSSEISFFNSTAGLTGL